jgi:PAS domain S-box-containing protein
MRISIPAIISLATFFIMILMGNFVFYQDRKARLNIAFFSGSMCMSWWALCEFLYRTAAGPDTAYFWMRMCFVWPMGDAFMISAMLHFVMGERYKRNPFGYAAVYTPAIAISIIHLFFPWLYMKQPVLMSWGYTTNPGPFFSVINIFAVITFVACTVIFSIVALKAETKLKRRQALILTLGTGIGIAFSMITQIRIAAFGAVVPETATVSMLICMTIIGYGAWKYRIFTFTEESAAKHIVSAMGEGLVMAGADNRITNVNDALCLMTGFLKEEIIGLPFESIFESVTSPVSGGGVSLPRLEATLKRKNNTPLDVITSCSFIKDKAGEAAGTVCLFRDISDRRERERIESAYESLKKDEEEKTEFISVIGHELKTPLTSIKGFASLINSGAAGSISDGQREYLQTIEANADRLIEMTSDFIDIMRIKSGSIPILKSTFDLCVCIESIAHRYNYFLNQDGITVKATHGAELAINGDERRIAQALGNLVALAAKYSLPDGIIEVECAGDGGDPGRVIVSVRDHCEPLKQSDVDAGFSGVMRTASKTYKKHLGTSFGLNISKAIIEAHGGAIWHEPAEGGQGNIFRVALPRQIYHQ